MFNVLAMGLSNSNDLFESALRELLQGLKSVVKSLMIFWSLDPPKKSTKVM